MSGQFYMFLPPIVSASPSATPPPQLVRLRLPRALCQFSRARLRHESQLGRGRRVRPPRLLISMLHHLHLLLYMSRLGHANLLGICIAPRIIHLYMYVLCVCVVFDLRREAHVRGVHVDAQRGSRLNPASHWGPLISALDCPCVQDLSLP